MLDTLRAKFTTVKLPKSFLAVNLSEGYNERGSRRERGSKFSPGNSPGGEERQGDGAKETEQGGDVPRTESGLLAVPVLSTSGT